MLIQTKIVNALRRLRKYSIHSWNLRRKMLFDEVLEQIGEGIFQKFAIFVCGLSMLAEAIATTCVSFAVILISCDLKISLDQILQLNAVFIFAMLLSGYWLGGISDMSGRKYVLSMTSIITFVGCFVASFSQCVIMLFISLFLLGMGIGGNHCATRMFIVEITPKCIRGSRFVFAELFYAFGYMSAIGLSRLLIPPMASTLIGNKIRLNSWRLLFGLSGSLSIFSACLMSVFPPSPRWLLAKKQEEEAIDILRKIYAVNKVKHEESFPKIQLDPITFINTRSESHSHQCNNSFIRSFRSIRIYTTYLFGKDLIKTTIASILISIFTFDGLVVMNIWLSLVLFTGNINECTIRGICPINVKSSNEICIERFLENLFVMNFYLSICSLVLVGMLCIADRIPRKFILMFSSLILGLSTIGFVFIEKDIFKTMFAFVVMSFMFITEIMFRLIVLESYPTIMRCTAYGFIKIFSKLCLALLVLLLRVPCQWGFVCFGALFILAGIFANLLPNLNKAPMRD